jgi:hypothetical protein
VQEKHRVAMGADTRMAVAENARALGVQALHRSLKSSTS